jgi:hypothetical protein
MAGTQSLALSSLWKQGHNIPKTLADLRLFTARKSPFANRKKPALGGVDSELV